MARARVGLGLLGVLEQFCYGLEAHYLATTVLRKKRQL